MQSSLTYEIDRKEGPVFAFLRDRFPAVPHLAAEAASSLKDCCPLVPETEIRWRHVGTATEYFLRACLPGFEFEGSVAWIGLTEQIRSRTRSARICREFLDIVPALLQRGQADHPLLARLCLCFANFSNLARGVSRPLTVSRWESLLTFPVAEVEEVALLGNIALRETLAQIERERVVNGLILGNELMGADADLVVGDCLINMKCTKLRCTRSVFTKHLYQLLGYVLLDEDDDLGVRSIGLLLPRQERLLRWALEDLGTSEVELRELRRSFRSAVRSLECS